MSTGFIQNISTGLYSKHVYGAVFKICLRGCIAVVGNCVSRNRVARVKADLNVGPRDLMEALTHHIAEETEAETDVSVKTGDSTNILKSYVTNTGQNTSAIDISTHQLTTIRF